ncbi:MAG: hypothetical protein VB093_04895 [Propionicimonas sp.]|nr:hypothetical protein [Propionicimonas sp.]MEA5116224.1 hypothetical protein [Propionicimonas sp.]
MAQTLRQQARRQVNEATATRKREFAEREARLAEAAVEVVAAIVARDRAEEGAANAIAAMAKERISLTEIGDRCGLSLKEVTRLKRTYLDAELSGARAIPGAAVAQGASRS